jgi:hypothetical protein
VYAEETDAAGGGGGADDDDDEDASDVLDGCEAMRGAPEANGSAMSGWLGGGWAARPDEAEDAVGNGAEATMRD